MQDLQPAATLKKGLTGSTLKWVALFTMALDHLTAAFLLPVFRAIATQETALPLTGLLYLLRGVGRLGFPLFAFLLVEGFFHTHDRKKYLLRLLVFSVLSEIPFDWAIFESPLYWGAQNVFFTLALGLAAIWCLDAHKEKPLLGWGGVLLCMVAAQLLWTDYSFFGVALIVVFYLFHDRRRGLYFAVPICLFVGSLSLNVLQTALLGGGIPLPELVASALFMALHETLGALSLFFIARYNGERGGRMPKYFFYAFYPVHLLLFALLRFVCFGY